MKTVDEVSKGKNKKGVKKGNLDSLKATGKFLLIFLRYTFLIAILVLLASHEAANPKIGKTDIEFYNAEFSRNMHAVFNSDISEEIRLVKQFYLQRQFLPAWTVNFDVTSSYNELEELIGSAWFYGLLPSEYYYYQLLECRQTLENSDTDATRMEARICLEQTSTKAAIKFMSHLSMGIGLNDSSAVTASLLNSLPITLNFHLNQNSLREGILTLQPENKQYKRLQSALEKYMYKAFRDTIVYNTEELRNNDSLISSRLIMQGFLDESFRMDSAARMAALRNFQRAHNLELTGKLDKATCNMLQLGTKDRFFKIALNLDRIRKDRLSSTHHILVNVPEFQLYYYTHEGKESNFCVIVGKKNSPTPLLQSQVEYIVANPFWTVPMSIARNELLPRIKCDSLYLKKHGFSVVDRYSKPVDDSSIDWNQVNADEFDYWFKQTNSNNALGDIKFIFPNEYSVYLHDTQSKKLFGRRERTFSHGCIRVQNPEKLAQLIMEDDESDNRKLDIRQIIRKKERKEIKMEEPLPIYIRYYTCSADSTGNIYYHPDIYSMDIEAIHKLFGNQAWN
jgi:murein L,D-transpeptidase YcbB/YkuD